MDIKDTWASTFETLTAAAQDNRRRTFYCFCLATLCIQVVLLQVNWALHFRSFWLVFINFTLLHFQSTPFIIWRVHCCQPCLYTSFALKETSSSAVTSLKVQLFPLSSYGAFKNLLGRISFQENGTRVHLKFLFIWNSAPHIASPRSIRVAKFLPSQLGTYFHVIFPLTWSTKLIARRLKGRRRLKQFINFTWLIWRCHKPMALVILLWCTLPLLLAHEHLLQRVNRTGTKYLVLLPKSVVLKLSGSSRTAVSACEDGEMAGEDLSLAVPVSGRVGEPCASLFRAPCVLEM